MIARAQRVLKEYRDEPRSWANRADPADLYTAIEDANGAASLLDGYRPRRILKRTRWRSRTRVRSLPRGIVARHAIGRGAGCAAESRRASPGRYARKAPRAAIRAAYSVLGAT